MPMTLDVFTPKWRRVVMTRLARAKSGDPDIGKPQPDDRGYLAPEHGPIFGVCQGDTVTVRLIREKIANNARLFVTSSDTTIFTVESPATGAHLSAASEIDIKIKGVGGGTPKKATLEIRFDSGKSSAPSGPIIHQAEIWVWHPIQCIPVLPHNVTIQKNSGPTPRPARASTANVTEIIKVVNAIWRPCGLTFIPSGGTTFAAATRNITVSMTKEGECPLAPFPAEPDKILTQGLRTRGVINAFFIHRFTGGTLGLGISPANKTAMGFSHSGIILADETEIGAPSGVPHTTPFSGNDLAHEIGHFLGLQHKELVHSNSSEADKAKVKDTWSQRCLMYQGNWATPLSTRRIVDYGTVRAFSGVRQLRGAMISMKTLTNRSSTTEGECTIARSNLSAF